MRPAIAITLTLAAGVLAGLPAIAGAQPPVPPVERRAPSPERAAADAAYGRLTPAEKRTVQAMAERARPLAAAIQNDQAAFTRDMAALNLNELLSPDFRRSDPDGAISKARLARAHQLVQQKRDLRIQREHDLIQPLETANLPAAVKAHYRQMFEQAAAYGRPRNSRTLDLTDEIITTLEQMVTTLTGSAWQYESGYVFESETALRAFAEQKARIDADNAEIAAIDKELAARAATMR